jgi:hypothetical protein
MPPKRKNKKPEKKDGPSKTVVEQKTAAPAKTSRAAEGEMPEKAVIAHALKAPEMAEALKNLQNAKRTTEEATPTPTPAPAAVEHRSLYDMGDVKDFAKICDSKYRGQSKMAWMWFKPSSWKPDKKSRKGSADTYYPAFDPMELYGVLKKITDFMTHEHKKTRGKFLHYELFKSLLFYLQRDEYASLVCSESNGRVYALLREPAYAAIALMSSFFSKEPPAVAVIGRMSLRGKTMSEKPESLFPESCKE